MRHRAILGTCLLHLAAAACGVSRADPLPLSAGEWLYDPLQWQMRAEGLRSTGPAASAAVFLDAPRCRSVTVEAKVRVARANDSQWKIAGVAICDDDQNFWHLALVEAPDAGPNARGHFCELTEMRAGTWLAERNLKVVASRADKTPWAAGTQYALRIRLDAEGIEGSITDAAGRVVFSRRYAFTGPAVRAGRPAVRCLGFDADFADIAAEHADPAAVPAAAFAPWQCDSFAASIRGEKTGFFHVARQGDRWWVIDPLGRGFVPLGVDHVTYEGHWCQKLGYAPHGRKNDRRYASRDAWAVETLGRLKSWGFNVLGSGSSAELFHRGLAHTRSLNVGTMMAAAGGPFCITPNESRPCSAFPNVFHPDFANYCRYLAERTCRPAVGDAWLLGYFLDNELAWWGRGGGETGLFDAVMRLPADHSAKAALRGFLSDRYGGDVGRFNRAWGAKLASFDVLPTLHELGGANGDAVRADKQAFLALVAETYFATATKAIRAVDPDHMILGCRFAGGYASPVVWAAAGRHCDILSLNFYGNVDLDRRVARDESDARAGATLDEAFSRFARLGGRPMMVTEWSFPALDSGLPCTKGAGQRFLTQAERATASEIYARAILQMPFMVGFDYFMWVDEPALGITDAFPENTNYGLINEDGRPYELLAAALSRVTRAAAAIHEQAPPAPSASQAAPAAPRPPAGPQGTQLVLWNRSTRQLPVTTVWLPSVPPAVAKAGGAMEAFDGGRWQATPAQLCPRQQGPAAAAVRVGPLAAGGVLYLRGAAGSAGAAGTPNPSLQFRRDGEKWSADSGAFAISGRIGGAGMTDAVRHRGVPLGRYNAMLHLRTDRGDVWVEAGRLTSADAAVGPLCMTVDLVADYGGGAGERDAGSFEIAHRLTLLPDADWFVVELLWCRNTGRRALDVRAFFFRGEGAIGGQAAGDRPISAAGVPRLWNATPGDAWVDQNVGAFWGFITEGQPRAAIWHWLDDRGRQHPDARCETAATIAPGEVFRPRRPMYLLSLAGRGGSAEWDRLARDVLEAMKLRVD